MVGYKLVLHEKAINELGDATEYYNSKSSNLGFEFEDEVFTVVDLIKRNPLLFPVKLARIHEAVVKRFPFVINYEVVGKQIVVLSVFHVKQHPSKKIKRKSK